MEIKSSVMDLTASGTHSFENIVDYKLQLDLSQILGRKVKAQNSEFGTIEDDGLGRIRIFLSMKGPLANPKISYDRKSIEQKIVQDVKQEKQDLKKILVGSRRIPLSPKHRSILPRKRKNWSWSWMKSSETFLNQSVSSISYIISTVMFRLLNVHHLN